MINANERGCSSVGRAPCVRFSEVAGSSPVTRARFFVPRRLCSQRGIFYTEIVLSLLTLPHLEDARLSGYRTTVPGSTGERG